MVHRLPTIVAGIHYDSITFFELLLARNLGRCRHQVTHQRRIFGERPGGRSDVPLGND